MAVKGRKRKSKPATEEPSIRERRRAPKANRPVRGGRSRKAGTVKEDKRMSSADEAEQKNIRADHDKATYELEASSEARPTRKSTRRGANRMKPDSQLRRRQTRAVRSPERRHAMRGG
jgi:hypothetical protein